MIEVDITQSVRALARLESALQRYRLAHADKTTEEVLEKKGRDVGIRFFSGFRARAWGGAGKVRGRTLAIAEAEERYRAGLGTRLRPAIREEYLARRRQLRREKRALRAQHADLKSQLGNQRARVSLWKTYLGRELAARGRGRGVLAASFLWYRSRQSRERGRYFVRNRSHRPLGYVEAGPASLRIVGLGNLDAQGNTGIGLVDQRYGITAGVLVASAADMERYLAERQTDTLTRDIAEGISR